MKIAINRQIYNKKSKDIISVIAGLRRKITNFANFSTSGKSPLTEFSDTDLSNHIISRFTHFKQPFHHKNKKQPILPH